MKKFAFTQPNFSYSIFLAGHDLKNQSVNKKEVVVKFYNVKKNRLTWNFQGNSLRAFKKCQKFEDFKAKKTVKMN